MVGRPCAQVNGCVDRVRFAMSVCIVYLSNTSPARIAEWQAIVAVRASGLLRRSSWPNSSRHFIKLWIGFFPARCAGIDLNKIFVGPRISKSQPADCKRIFSSSACSEMDKEVEIIAELSNGCDFIDEFKNAVCNSSYLTRSSAACWSIKSKPLGPSQRIYVFLSWPMGITEALSAEMNGIFFCDSTKLKDKLAATVFSSLTNELDTAFGLWIRGFRNNPMFGLLDSDGRRES